VACPANRGMRLAACTGHAVLPDALAPTGDGIPVGEQRQEGLVPLPEHCPGLFVGLALRIVWTDRHEAGKESGSHQALR